MSSHMENPFLNEVQNDVKAYAQTLTTVGKLRLVGGISRVLGLFLLILTIILLLFGFIALCAVAAIHGLSFVMPIWAAALIVAASYIILIAVVIILRKQLFINPFVRLLSGVFFAEEGRKIEELRLRKEAEND